MKIKTRAPALALHLNWLSLWWNHCSKCPVPTSTDNWNHQSIFFLGAESNSEKLGITYKTERSKSLNLDMFADPPGLIFPEEVGLLKCIIAGRILEQRPSGCQPPQKQSTHKGRVEFTQCGLRLSWSLWLRCVEGHQNCTTLSLKNSLKMSYRAAFPNLL